MKLLFFVLVVCGVARAENVVFPADAGFVNVKEKYGAKGDGKTDDTEALQLALQKESRLYLPNGVYLVSDKISQGRRNRSIVWQGQSEKGTVVRLAPYSSGFEDARRKKVLFSNYESSEATNVQFHNGVYNMTFEVGEGNPGAVALQHTTSNQGGVYDVTLRSLDPQGRGAAGLDLTQPWPGPAIYKRVSVEGFDIGIDVATGEYSVVFEHIRLKNQRVAGVRNDHNVLTIRKLTSQNAVPALRNENAGSMISLYDSALNGGDAKRAAIENRGKLLARNVAQNGYGTFVDNRADALPDVSGARIEEYVSHGVSKLFANDGKTLNLPVEETPEPAWDAPENWVKVEFSQADNDDDTSAIQAAFDRAAREGKKTVYFGKRDREYSCRFGDTVRVHGSVERVIGMDATFGVTEKMRYSKKALFRVEELTAPFVVFERFFVTQWDNADFYWLEQNTTRPVVLKNVCGFGGSAYKGGIANSKFFIEDVCGGTPSEVDTKFVGLNFPFKNQKVWARQWNPESNETMAWNEGGDFWVLGVKTEGRPVVIWTKNGGRTEVLGGFLYNAWRDRPHPPAAFVVEDSDGSFTYAETAWNDKKHYKIHVQETQNGVTRKLMRDEFDAGGRGPGGTFPLAVARRGAKAEVPLVLVRAKDNRASEKAGETGPDTAVFEVSRRGATDAPLTLAYALEGATNFAPLPGKITIPAGAPSAEIVLTPVGDGKSTGLQTVALHLTRGANYDVTGGAASALVADADAPPVGSGTGLRAEFFGGAFTQLGATRTDATFARQTAQIARWSGQIEPQYSEIFTFTSPEGGYRLWIDGRLAIDAWNRFGEQRGYANFEAGRRSDIKIEARASLALSWQSPSLEKQLVPLTQLYPASASSPIVRLQLADATASEKGADAAQITVAREGDATSALPVRLLVRGVARNAQDVKLIVPELTLAAGQKTASVTVTPINDTEIEGNETLEIALAPDALYSASGEPLEIVVADDDAPPGTGIGTGLRGDYYAGRWKPETGVTFDALKHSRVDETVNFAWRATSPAPGLAGGDEGAFATIWSGFIEPRFGEEYTFSVFFDDGARLWVNGALLINQLPWFAGEKSGKIALEAHKRVPIRLEYMNKDGQATAILKWESATQKEQVVPQSQLYPAPNEPAILSVAATSASERDAKPGQITITRRGDLQTPLALGLKVEGSAKAGEDFQALPTQLKLAAEQKTLALPIVPLDDKVAEPDEAIEVVLPLSPLYVRSGAATTSVPLNDDDLPPPGKGRGLKAQYFADKEMQDAKISRVDATLDLEGDRGWDGRSPDKKKLREGTFYARWSGQIEPLFSETYSFFLSTGGGKGALKVNGQSVIERGQKKGEIVLEAGRKYDVVVEYETPRDGWNAQARLEWQSASQFRQVVPPTQLYPAK